MSDSGAMDSHLLDVAMGQCGLLTTAQARRAGVDKWGLRRRVRDRDLLSVTRGVYAVWTESEGQLSDDARHLRLGRAMTLLYPDARLAGHTALAAMGLPTWGADLSRAHVERPVTKEVLTQDAVIRPVFDASAMLKNVQDQTRTADEADPDLTDPEQASSRLPTVSPAVAVVQHTLQNGAPAGIVAADAALHRGLFCLDELERLADWVRGWPRSSRVQTMLAHTDARSESVGESRLRFGMALLGLELIPQVRIRDDRGEVVARVDFLLAGTNVVVEFDGLVKYREGGAEALIAEKRREDELRGLGYVVVRVVWSELNRPSLVAARIRAAASTGKVALHPRQEVG
jgi:very-short-patch-repair endonuclease